MLSPGDVVTIPDAELKRVKLVTGKRHVITVHRAPKVLRLSILGCDGKPLKNTPFVLLIDGQPSIEKATDGSGKLEAPVPFNAQTATLKIAGRELGLRLGHMNPATDAPDGGISGVQARLNNLGYAVGPNDGALGPQTKAALEAFQEEQGLDVTGTPDPATVDKLQTLHGC